MKSTLQRFLLSPCEVCSNNFKLEQIFDGWVNNLQRSFYSNLTQVYLIEGFVSKAPQSQIYQSINKDFFVYFKNLFVFNLKHSQMFHYWHPLSKKFQFFSWTSFSFMGPLPLSLMI